MHASILVCDDEAHIRHIIAHKLRAVGFNVVEARNGEEAKAHFEPGGAGRAQPSPEINLVITDYQMPFVTGLELCKFLKARPATSAMPVLMLTARGYTLSDEDLAQTNIQEVISKPFGVRLLLERVVKELCSTCPELVPPELRTMNGPEAGPLAA